MARYVHPHFQRNANELRDWSYNDAKAKYETAGAAVEGRRAGGDRQVPGRQEIEAGLEFFHLGWKHRSRTLILVLISSKDGPRAPMPWFDRLNTGMAQAAEVT